MAITQVPIELSSTPGIVDNSNATAITIDSSENVGIGTSSPDSPLEIDGGSTDNTVLHLTSGTANTFLKLSDSNSTNGTFIGATTNDLNFYPNNTLAVTMAASGNVGIGTSSPGQALSVESSSVGVTRVDITNTGNAAAGSGIHLITKNGATQVSNATLRTDNAGNFTIFTGTTGETERLRITSAGSVGIGTSSPSQKLHVYESSTSSQAYVTVQNNRSRNAAVLTQTTNGGFYTGTSIGTDTLCWQVYDASAGERMRITSGGQLFLFNQTSGAGNADLRYTTGTGAVTYDTSSRLVKDEIEDIPYGLSTVMALSPKRYQRTDSDNKLEVGFIADEVVEIVPELVGMMEKRFLTMNQEDTEVVAGSVEYNKMTAVLVKAVQEQQATITALEARIAQLETP